MIFIKALLPVVCAAATAAPPGALKPKIDRVLARKCLRSATVGVHVVRVDTGAVVYSRSAAKPFILASNTKVFAAAAAVFLLGADFKFTTRVLRHGLLAEGGVVQGDLVVVGDGDPNISGRHSDGKVTAIFKRCAQALKDRGVRRVTGDLVGDDRIFDRDFLRPDTGRYTSPVSGLPFNDNCIHVFVAPTRPGAAASVWAEPSTRYVSLINRITTHSSRKKDHAWFVPSSGGLQARGNVYAKAPRRRYRVNVTDPSLYFATVFAETLRGAGIQIDGRPRLPKSGETFQGAAELAKVTSGLDVTLPVMNQLSNNFYADSLFKRIGAQATGRGTFASGARAIAQFLAEIRAPLAERRFADGCGLSRDNIATPHTTTHVLRYMARSRAAAMFRGSLAAPGQEGTLRRRLTKEPYASRVRAKSGYIREVSGLSGYAQSRRGAAYAFSILINGFRASNAEMKAVQDDVCRAIVDEG